MQALSSSLRYPKPPYLSSLPLKSLPLASTIDTLLAIARLLIHSTRQHSLYSNSSAHFIISNFIHWCHSYCTSQNTSSQAHFLFSILVNSLNIYGCSTAILKSPPMESYFSQLIVHCMGLYHPWPPVIENWFLCYKIRTWRSNQRPSTTVCHSINATMGWAVYHFYFLHTSYTTGLCPSHCWCNYSLLQTLLPIRPNPELLSKHWMLSSLNTPHSFWAPHSFHILHPLPLVTPSTSNNPLSQMVCH